MTRALLFVAGLGIIFAQAATRPIILNWQPSTSSGVVGYNVYKSAVAGGPYAKLNPAPINGLSFTDPGEPIGGSVFYVATAVAPACTVPPSGPCGESGFSSPEVSVINIPARPAGPGQVILVIP